MSERGVRIGNRYYNIGKSILVCETPRGKLYKKTGRGVDFFLYDKDGETNAKKYIDVSWADANNLTKTYGSREMQDKYFSLFEKSTDQNNGRYTSINLDEYHSLKAFRNAQAHNMSMTTYIKYLIDKEDEQNNYCL